MTSVFSPGRGQLKPLDLAQGLKRECDDQIQVLDRT
ncbi:MAG: FhaA domain-containing protein, partial [Brachybacterium sp.]